MNPPAWSMDLVDAAVWASTASVVWFVVQYTLSSPWWHDPVGRTVVAKDIALLLLLVPICVLLVWPHAFNPDEQVAIDLVSLWLVAASMAWRCAVWWKIRPPRLRRAKPISKGEI